MIIITLLKKIFIITNRNKGATAIEYMMVAALLSVASIAAFKRVFVSFNNVSTGISQEFSNAVNDK